VKENGIVAADGRSIVLQSGAHETLCFGRVDMNGDVRRMIVPSLLTSAAP
jgi:hypothetical protein